MVYSPCKGRRRIQFAGNDHFIHNLIMILGIAGTHGAGKGAVVQMLKEQGYIHCSVRELLVEELARRNVAPDRPAISALANELREKHGADYIAKTFMERCSPAVNNVVIESIYTMSEVKAIREAGGYVVAVDADPEIRYDRIKHRMSETDSVTKEQFMAMQNKESRSEDPNKQDSATVMENADFHITNDDGLAELRTQVEDMLKKIEEMTEAEENPDSTIDTEQSNEL